VNRVCLRFRRIDEWTGLSDLRVGAVIKDRNVVRRWSWSGVHERDQRLFNHIVAGGDIERAGSRFLAVRPPRSQAGNPAPLAGTL
jgi:hypothetical protein